MYKKKKCFEKEMVVSGGLRKRKREQWVGFFGLIWEKNKLIGGVLVIPLNL
jgi:hypothetical protein